VTQRATVRLTESANLLESRTDASVDESGTGVIIENASQVL
jgi:hypothetical protein